MVCQILSTVLCRRFWTTGFIGLIAPLVLLAGGVWGDDYHILMVREGGPDPVSGRPSGQLVIDAGFVAGVNEGATGVVWRKNKYKGQLELADLTVVAVTAEDALCKYTLRVADIQVLKKDRATLTPVPPAEADILARGIAAQDSRQYFDALLYFQRIFCTNLENAFVQQLISNCLTQVESSLAGSAAEEEKQLERSRQWQNLELAEGHHAGGHELTADLYLRRVLAVDPAQARATALRDSIKVQDLSALFSPARCQ